MPSSLSKDCPLPARPRSRLPRGSSFREPLLSSSLRSPPAFLRGLRPAHHPPQPSGPPPCTLPTSAPSAHTQLPRPIRLPCAPCAPRCPRPRSFTRRLRDASRSPRTWRPALLNHPPTTPLPPSRHFRPQRPHAQPLPVVRQSNSGQNVDSDWPLVDLEASGVAGDRQGVTFLLAPCP